jgi:hypothetical protein
MNTITQKQESKIHIKYFKHGGFSLKVKTRNGNDITIKFNQMGCAVGSSYMKINETNFEVISSMPSYTDYNVGGVWVRSFFTSSCGYGEFIQLLNN